MLYALLALVSAGVAAYFFYTFQNSEGSTTSMILGIVFAIAAVALAGFFLFNKMTHQEEIHITE
jgi:uncharacterized membrane protein YeaQ/YmgE (transglycosylase-associated protein family)